MFSVFCASFCASLFISMTRRFHMPVSGRRDDLNAVQSAHAAPVPRIGGIGIVLGLLVAMLLSEGSAQATICLLLISAIPVFLVGLLEDFTGSISAKKRYIAAVLSGVVAVLVFGVWIDRMSAPLFGVLVSVLPLGILITLFTTAGYAHAFNLIDGLNGLSSGVAALAALGMRLGR